jgi:hypothetical protein
MKARTLAGTALVIAASTAVPALAQTAPASPATLADLTGSLSVTDVIAAIMATAGLAATVMLAWAGARRALRAIGWIG